MSEDVVAHLARLDERWKMMTDQFGTLQDEFGGLRQEMQKVVSLVDALAALERRHTSLEQAVRAQWTKVDPLVHSDPPITARVRANEEALSTVRSEVSNLVKFVDELKATHRKLTWAVVAFIAAGIGNAIIQFGVG